MTKRLLHAAALCRPGLMPGLFSLLHDVGELIGGQPDTSTCCTLDVAGYGGIGITDEGRALLCGEGAFLYREDTVAAPAGRSRARPDKGADPALDDDAAALLGVLKALRLELARERGVPAYIV